MRDDQQRLIEDGLADRLLERGFVEQRTRGCPGMEAPELASALYIQWTISSTARRA